MLPPPVVDYERMKRVYPRLMSTEGHSVYTYICLFFIVVGILVLIKRYKDKRSFTIGA